MSIDMIMYKARKVSAAKLKKLHGTPYAELPYDEEWECKAYDKDEVDANPERFVEILPFMKPVELERTIIDYRSCFIAHGMPENTTSYSVSYRNRHSVIINFGDTRILLTNDDFEPYTEHKLITYMVYERQTKDVDDMSWLNRTLRDKFSDILTAKAQKQSDTPVTRVNMSYRPHKLEKQDVEEILRTTIQEYDNECLSDSCALNFIVNFVRQYLNPEHNIFIEFQD